jgi:hypothetical protein
MVFQYNNCNIIPFFYYFKNEFEILLLFINTCNIHYILSYLNINSQLYFLLTVKKIYY